MDLNGTGPTKSSPPGRSIPIPPAASRITTRSSTPSTALPNGAPWVRPGRAASCFSTRHRPQNFGLSHPPTRRIGPGGRASQARTGPLNIYELNDSDSVVAFDKSQPFGLWGKGMLHKQFGKEPAADDRLLSNARSTFTPRTSTATAWTKCSSAGTATQHLWQPNETILDDDGAILWRRWLPHVTYPNNYGWLNSACLIPVNPDHDNHIDVLGFNHPTKSPSATGTASNWWTVPAGPRIFTRSCPRRRWWATWTATGPGGNHHRHLQPDPHALRGRPLDLRSGRHAQADSLRVPGGIKHIPALADVEGNGRLDVIYRSLARAGECAELRRHHHQPRLLGHAPRQHAARRQLRRLALPARHAARHEKTSGYNRASFTWTNCHAGANAIASIRAEQAAGPFQHIATVTAATTAYTDYGLKPGWQYFYEVGAVYSTNTVHSAPLRCSRCSTATSSPTPASRRTTTATGTNGSRGSIADDEHGRQHQRRLPGQAIHAHHPAKPGQQRHHLPIQPIRHSRLHPLRHARRVLQLWRLVQEHRHLPALRALARMGARPRPATTPTTAPACPTRTTSPRSSRSAPARPIGLTKTALSSCPPDFPTSNCATATACRPGQRLHLPRQRLLPPNPRAHRHQLDRPGPLRRHLAVFHHHPADQLVRGRLQRSPPGRSAQPSSATAAAPRTSSPACRNCARPTTSAEPSTLASADIEELLLSATCTDNPGQFALLAAPLPQRH